MFWKNFKKKNMPRIGRDWEEVHDVIVSIDITDCLNAESANVQEYRSNKYGKMDQEIRDTIIHQQQEAWTEIAALPPGLDTESNQNGESVEGVTVQDQDSNFVDVNYLSARVEGSARDIPIQDKNNTKIQRVKL